MNSFAGRTEKVSRSPTGITAREGGGETGGGVGVVRLSLVGLRAGPVGLGVAGGVRTVVRGPNIRLRKPNIRLREVVKLWVIRGARERLSTVVLQVGSINMAGDGMEIEVGHRVLLIILAFP